MNKIILSLFFLLFAHPFLGQTLEPKVKPFSVYESNNSSFMPPTASITDEYGITWISTEMGLLRYDGLNVVKIEDVNYPKISSQRIRRLSKDIMTGYIYFNTYPDKDWFRIKKGRIEKVIPEGFSFYINTPKKKILQFNDARLKKILLPQNHTPADVISDFNKASIMEILNVFKTSQYLYFHKQEKLIIVDLNRDYKIVTYSLPIHNLVFSLGGYIYFLKDKKFCMIKGSRLVSKGINVDYVLHQFAQKFEITHPDNNRMMMTETGDCYIILDDKIYKVVQQGDFLKTIYIAGAFSKDICDLNYYKTENIFLLSGFVSGFTKLIPQNFNQLVFKDPNLVNYSIIPVGQNTIYCATGWLYNLKTNEYKRDNYTLNRNKYFILKKKNAAYVQIGNRVVNINNPRDSLITDRKNHLGYYSGFTFSDGKMWVSQANQSNLLYSGTHEKIATDTFVTAKLQGKTITYLMPVGKELLITTMEGLYRYNPSIKKIQFYKQFGKKYIRKLIPISENSFWICCYGDGLFLFQDDKFYKVNANHDDFSAIHTLEEDKQQNLWISSNNGLFTVNKAILITNTLQGKTTSLYKFSIKDGLLTNEFNGGSTHPSFKNEEGLIGFASMRGVLWFNPERIKKAKFSGNIYIHSVLQDGKQIQPVNHTYKLGSNTNLVIMKLFYPYYNNRENLIVEYKNGDNNNWSKVIDDKIVFTRQKEGSQKVWVRITTKGFGNNSSVVKSFHFYFEPRYYETIWFLVLCILALVVLLFTSFKIGLAINKKYRKKLEERIREKTVELEESNKMLFESREDISKSLKEKELLLKEIHHRVKNNLQLVISLLNIQGRKNNYQTIEEFLEKGQTRIMAMVLIHENLYQNDSIERLNVNKYLQSLVQKIIEAFGINSDNIVVHIEAENITMNLQTAIPFGLMINEFVTNSVKHAFPDNSNGEIKIVLSQKSNEEFELKMEDNGIGFKTERPAKKSFGLELIKLLTNQLNGTIQMMTEGNTCFHIAFKESMV